MKTPRRSAQVAGGMSKQCGNGRTSQAIRRPHDELDGAAKPETPPPPAAAAPGGALEWG